MSQIDPWEKAGECIQAINQTSEPELRELLKAIRDLWIKLGNQRPLLTGQEFASEVAKIGRMHSHLIPA